LTRYEEWSLGVSIVSAVVTVGVLVVYVYQLRAMRDAVGVAQAAAEAAKRSADAAMSTEGALLMAEMGMSHIAILSGDWRTAGYVPFEVRITNYGRTPALVTDTWLSFRILGAKESLPVEPDYTGGDLGVVNPGAKSILTPGENFQIRVQVLAETFERTIQKQSSFYVYGRILYRDIFNRRLETRFCFRIDGYISKLDGPEAYNYYKYPN
jgi:hypothetical protein